MKRHFWSWIRDDGGGRVLRLEGPIDEESFWNDGVTPKAFRNDLYAEDGDVTVYINSPGGNVFAAAEIYSMIRDYPGKVTVRIDAIAASAASVIAMAGDIVQMSPVAMYMLHDPVTIAVGNAKAMEKTITTLNEVKESIINAYQAKSKLSRNKIARLMTDETWLNAKKAVELGFADEIMFDDAGAEAETGDDDNDESTEPSPTPDAQKEGIHLDRRRLAEGLLYSTRIMGETILNSIGVAPPETPQEQQSSTDRQPEVVDGQSDSDGEQPGPTEEQTKETSHLPDSSKPDITAVDDAASVATNPPNPGETQSEGEAAIMEENPSEEGAPVNAEGFFVIGPDGRTQDGSVPYEILKNQLDRMR